MDQEAASADDAATAAQTEAAAVAQPPLAVALAHAAISTDAALVCALACTCSSWRQAVGHSSACNTVVKLGPSSSSNSRSRRRHAAGGSSSSSSSSLATLAKFAMWLPRHAGLVQSITVNRPQEKAAGSTDFQVAAEPLLVLSLQAAAAAPTAAAGPLDQHLDNPAHLWRLQRFESDFLHTPAMMSSLPAASLSCLRLSSISRRTASTAAFAAALGSLTGLQELLLSTLQPPLPGSCIAALGRLSKLQSLSLKQVARSELLQALPAQHLRSLLVELAPAASAQPSRKQALAASPSSPATTAAAAGARGACLDLRYLHGLQQLVMVSDTPLSSSGTALPQQLTALTMCKDSVPVSTVGTGGGSSALPAFVVSSEVLGAVDLSGLPHLGALLLGDESVASGSHLQQRIAALPHLQHLALSYDRVEAAAAAAPAWQSIRHLSELTLHFESAKAARGSWTRVLSGLQAAASLTYLRFYTGGSDAAGGVPLCSFLSPLTNLRSLWVDVLLTPDDALHLSSLQQLTFLDLAGCTQHMADMAVAALCGLSSLVHLDLASTGVNITSALPVVARDLTRLPFLRLDDGNEGVSEAGLRLMTALNKLSALGHELSPGVVGSFWQAMKSVK